MTLTDVLKTREEYAKSLSLSGLLSIDNPSGEGIIEVGGTTNARIDLKSPFADDFDVRLGTIGGTSARLETSANQSLMIDAGTGVLFIQPNASGNVGIGVSSPTEKLDVFGNIKSNGNIEAAVSLISQNIEVGSTSGTPFIDIKNPTVDDYDIRLTTDGTNGIIASLQKIVLQPAPSKAVSISNIGTYANNAAAIAGGLAVNDVYKTATGELRIVV
jgi:hypothetical protein